MLDHRSWIWSMERLYIFWALRWDQCLWGGIRKLSLQIVLFTNILLALRNFTCSLLTQMHPLKKNKIELQTNSFVLPKHSWLCCFPLPEAILVKKTNFPSPNSYQLPRAPWLWVELHVKLPLPCRELFWLQLAQVLPVSCNSWKSTHTQLLCCI